MAAKETPKVKLIVANATKIKPNDRLIVVISMNDADGETVEGIYEALAELTGQPQHYVLPLMRPEDLKFYAIEGTETVSVELPQDPHS